MPCYYCGSIKHSSSQHKTCAVCGSHDHDTKEHEKTVRLSAKNGRGTLVRK